MVYRALFHRRENTDRREPAECWFLLRGSDSSYWVEHARETAAADEVETIAVVRIGRFFAQVEDAFLLRDLRKALAKAVA